ncbi:MAG: hypothetical protein ABUL44_00845, partial [Flavobacterium sp.]
GGIDWFLNTKTKKLVQNKNENQGYEKKLGKDWIWFAEDEAFSYYNGGFDPNDADRIVFAAKNKLSEIEFSSSQSRSILENSGYKEAPTHYLQLTTTVTVYGESGSAGSETSQQVWLETTYIPKGYVISGRKSNFLQTKYFGSSMIRRQIEEYSNITYAEHSSLALWDRVNGVLDLSQRQMNYEPKIYNGWNNYKGPLLFYKK